jgi:hypothetical protein
MAYVEARVKTRHFSALYQEAKKNGLVVENKFHLTSIP